MTQAKFYRNFVLTSSLCDNMLIDIVFDNCLVPSDYFVY